MWLTIFAAAVPSVQAQQHEPHLGYVFPAGGRQGSTFQVKIGGQFLANPVKAYFSGIGVQATIVDYIRPLNGQQLTQLREKLQELQKGTKDNATLMEMANIRAQISLKAGFSFKRRRNMVKCSTRFCAP